HAVEVEPRVSDARLLARASAAHRRDDDRSRSRQIRDQALRCHHDCGTMINQKIVRGMTMAGIAHGIGAALYEEVAYDTQGQLVAQTLMDYLLPSAHEVPPVEIIHHVTPSPHTALGQKSPASPTISGRQARSQAPPI